MTRLIGFSLGETVDRVSILLLKQLAIKETAHTVVVDREQVEDELRKLITKIVGEIPNEKDYHVMQHSLELTIYNTMIWVSEDELRRIRTRLDLGKSRENDALYMKAGMLSTRTQMLNDLRYEAIASLNRYFSGQPDKVNIKL